MKIHGRHYRTIWVRDDNWSVETFDQTKLPHAFETVVLRTMEDAAVAICNMTVRGAPLTKTAQVKLVGNSVAPPIATAIVRAQFRTAHVERPAPRPVARPAQVEAHPVQPARPSKPAPVQPTLPGFTIVTPPRSYYVAGPTRTGKVIFDGARGGK